MERKPEILKNQIKWLCQSITEQTREHARLNLKWTQCFWLDEEGTPHIMQNDLVERMEKIEAQIKKDYITLREWKEEVQELESKKGES